MTDPLTGEVTTYWSAITGTLSQRGLLRERPRRGGEVLPEADAYLLTDRAIYVLDLQRLGGIPRERWLDPSLWAQWRAALSGRRCFVSDGGGLAITVARQPGERRKRLPKMIDLTPAHLPEKAYHICLGYGKRGAVLLDLARDNRAVLIGGTSGSGKTNLMQSIVLQLAAKHTPAEVQFAIVDCKQVDFGADYERLPHLFAPIAHDLEEATRLIESVEVERLRRQGIMAAAGVSDWRKCDGLGLLLLTVDEAADFAKTAAMETLVDVARKGRAFGISLVLGTQSPSSKVIDPQIRANLPTAVAFQCRTDIESRVILGKRGAEALNRPGLALAFLGGRWDKVQTLRVDQVDGFVEEQVAVTRPTLSDVETDLVKYAAEELDGCFTINKLAPAFQGDISRRQIVKLGQKWEARGWLTQPAHATDARRLTPDLCTLALDGQRGNTVTGETGGNRDEQVVTGSGNTPELPPFLRDRVVTQEEVQG